MLRCLGVGSALLFLGSLLSAQEPDSAGVGFPSLDSLRLHPRVAHYIDYFTGPARGRMSTWLSRRAPYRALIRSKLDRAGLPPELEYLPLIESGYSNRATSHAGAVGMWQFIPSTARDMGLRIDRFVDERRDPFRATDAAVRHIRDLRGEFGSSLLAAAAYNAGAGRVRRGLGQLERSGGSGPFRDSDFFRLAERGLLAKETRDYVPKLIAAAAIGQDPARFGFTPDSVEAQANDSLAVPRAVSLASAARAIGLDPTALRDLNPQFVLGVTPPGRTSWLRLPPALRDSLEARLPDLPTVRAIPPRRRPGIGPLIRVKRGDTVDSIAARHGVRAAVVRRMNALPTWYRLRAGQALRLPAR